MSYSLDIGARVIAWIEEDLINLSRMTRKSLIKCRLLYPKHDKREIVCTKKNEWEEELLDTIATLEQKKSN